VNLPLAAIEGYMLVGFWKALIILVPFVAWAWFVSSVLDKHAARFFLPRERWNLIHLIAGLVALALAFGMPIQTEWGFLVGLAAMMAVLAADIGAYVIVSSRDERVPKEHHIRLDLSSWKQARAERAVAKHQGTVELTIRNPAGKTIPPPDAESPEFAVRIAAEGILAAAIEGRASQADLIPAGESRYGVSLVVDGVRQAGGEPMTAPDAVKLIDFWKSAAGLDLGDRRRRQWADIRVTRDGVDRMVRVATSGGQGGLRLTLTLDPAKAVRRDADDLGMLPAQYAEVEAIAKEDTGGIVLLAAPPHNGRTTTLYSMLRLHDAYTSNVQTLEIEPQDEIEGVRQNRFDPYAEGPEFSTMLRSILRRDPDVVGVAETPDAKTLVEACKGDQERSRTYISVRGDSAIAVLQAFLKGVGDSELAGNALHGVVAQKLVRRLCSNCRVPYQPQPETVRKLGLPPDKVKQLFKKGGQVLIKNKPAICPVCSGTGFSGQVGVFEVYRIGREERALLAKGDLKAVAAEFKKRKLPTLQQAALIRATEGVTSVEEVIRISSPPPAPGAARPKQAEAAPSA
jgi:type II secretory ATPase GspE/PulE/Tfp pilus assembly ATPase PilB-like protein